MARGQSGLCGDGQQRVPLSQDATKDPFRSARRDTPGSAAVRVRGADRHPDAGLAADFLGHGWLQVVLVHLDYELEVVFLIARYLVVDLAGAVRPPVRPVQVRSVAQDEDGQRR